MTVLVLVAPPVLPDQISPLCGLLAAVLRETEAGLVICDAARLEDPDVATVDLLARLQLAAQRLGREVRIARPPDALLDLLALLGLSDMVPLYADLTVERRRQTEQGEERRRVEEEGDPRYPAV